MEGEEVKKPMSTMNKIINIFAAPREVFEAINEKPTWFVPFIIVSIFIGIMMFMTVDVQHSDQIKVIEALNLPQQQTGSSQGLLSYMSVITTPLVVLIINLIIAGLLLLGSSLMIGGEEVGYKKILSLIMWSGLIGIISVPLATFLAIQKGTMIGNALDLSILLPSVPIGESKTWLHYLLGRFDLFVFWQMILWVIGLSVMYKTTIKKAMTPVLTLWAIWVIIAVGLGPYIGKFFPGM